MFHKLTWFLAYRYFRSKHENGLISFISVISVLGVTLGTAVLIVVLSVLTGFKQHIEQKLLQRQPHLIIEHHNSCDLTQIENKINKISKKLNLKYDLIPLIKEHGLLKNDHGIMPVNIISHKNDTNDNSDNNDDGVIISQNLANKFKLKKHDKIILAAPVLNESIVGMQPRFKRFNIAGFIDSKDSKILNHVEQVDIIMPYDLALKFFNLNADYISGLYVYLSQPLSAYDLRTAIIDERVFRDDNIPLISTWYEYNKNLFQAIKLERISIVLLLCIIITVACFNLISGLYIQVAEKQKNMAILRTYGLSGFSISSIFIIQGIIIGLFGSVAGSIIGLSISYNLDVIVQFFQSLGLFHDGNIFLNAIANHMIIIKPNIGEVRLIVFFSFIMCILATIAPAARAKNISPIELIKND